MTITAAYQAYVADRQVYVAAGTLKTYAGHLKLFFYFLEERYRKDVTALSFSDMPDNIYSAYILYLRQKGVKNTTIRSYCRSVKAFLKYCYEEDICQDYLKKVKLPKDDAAPKMVLFQDEVDKIDGCFDLFTELGVRNYCIVHLMLDCGLRSQEVIHLQVSDILKDRNVIQILNTKGCKSRLTLIPDFLLQQIDTYLSISGRASGVIFLSMKDRKPMTSNAIKQLFQDLKVSSGIDRVHAHLLRHTFATSYLIGGGNLEFLRVFMGHSDYNVTKIYSQMAAQYKMLGADVYKLDSIFFSRGY